MQEWHSHAYSFGLHHVAVSSKAICRRSTVISWDMQEILLSTLQCVLMLVSFLISLESWLKGKPDRISHLNVSRHLANLPGRSTELWSDSVTWIIRSFRFSRQPMLIEWVDWFESNLSKSDLGRQPEIFSMPWLCYTKIMHNILASFCHAKSGMRTFPLTSAAIIQRRSHHSTVAGDAVVCRKPTLKQTPILEQYSW